MELIKQHLKKLLVAIGAVAVVGGGVMLGGDAEDLQTIIDNVASSQSDYYEANGTYEHTATAELGIYDYYCYQYVNAINQSGYQLFVEKGTGTSTEIMSVGYGPEASDRTHDWTLKYQDE